MSFICTISHLFIKAILNKDFYRDFVCFSEQPHKKRQISLEENDHISHFFFKLKIRREKTSANYVLTSPPNSLSF